MAVQIEVVGIMVIGAKGKPHHDRSAGDQGPGQKIGGTNLTKRCN